MRTIGVVTGSRSDYGIYLPLLRAITSDPSLSLSLHVTGMHLSPEFGSTASMIDADGFSTYERVEMLLSSDSPEGIAKSMGLGTTGFAQLFGRCRPNLLVVLGDRFEMHAATVAALPFKIPVAHIHGGEVTEGAIDDALRHSITKLSHLHFVSTEASARRLIQMGEEPWRISISGALSLDNLNSMKLLDRPALEDRIDLSLEPPPLLVTFHPTTLEYEQTEWQVRELLSALHRCGRPIVFTMPNADTYGRMILRFIRAFVEERASAVLVENLGTEAYFSLMALAGAMVGNSSSGIIEGMSFSLPVVNVGLRQAGRFKPDNVIDVDNSCDSILAGLQRALSPEMRTRLVGRPNPYGDGKAAVRIVQKLKEVRLDAMLLQKRFYALPADWSGAKDPSHG